MCQIECSQIEQEVTHFIQFLTEKRKSAHTLEKYARDAQLFLDFLNGREITDQEIEDFNNWLFVVRNYKENSVQSYLVVAKCYCNQYKGLNLKFPAKAKNPKPQQKQPVDLLTGVTYQEYQRLVDTAYEENLPRIGMMIQVIAGMGLKVSEIQYLTKTALKNRYVTVQRKGRERLLAIPELLAQGLEEYIQKRNITSEIILCTSSGKAVNRSNITRDIKKLCEIAGVDPGKMSPEKIRGRFAVQFVRSV